MRTEVTSFYDFPDEASAIRAARVFECVLRLGEDDDEARAEVEDEIADSEDLFEAADRIEDLLGFFDEGVEVLGVAREGCRVAVGLRIHSGVDEHRFEEGAEDDPGSEDLEAALADLCVALGGKDPRTWPLPPVGWRERVPAVSDVVVDGVGSTARARPAGRGTAVLTLRPFVAEDALEGALRACIARGAGFIAVDLQGVEIVPAKAFDVLATALAHVRAQGGDLVLFGLEPHVRRNLDDAGLPEPPAVAADEGRALRALSPQ